MKGETLREFGARVYVGDSPPDMLGAAIARAVAVGVATGPHDAAELIAAGAHIVLPTLDDFPAWFTDWRRGAI
jgi:phosphoglycolate phosphatase